MLLFRFLTLPWISGWVWGPGRLSRSSRSKLSHALPKLGRGVNCLRPAVPMEDEAREVGETASESHGPFGVVSYRNGGLEDGGL